MTITPEQQNGLARICEENGVARLAVFGSYNGGEANETSDLDLLVEFAPSRAPGFFGLAKLADDLSKIFGGLPVDLRTLRDLSHHFRDQVAGSAEVLYAA